MDIYFLFFIQIDKYPLVSTIIPTYNGSQFIRGAIVSVLTQTYPNIECIVTDDASTDDTISIVQNLQMIDQRIVLLTSNQNRGISSNLNMGLAVAKGSLISILDQDDRWIDSYKIQKQVEFLQGHPEIGFLGTNMIVRKQSLEGESFYGSANFATDSILKKNILLNNPFSHSSVMYRNICQKIGGYPEDVKYCPDYGYWLKAGLHTGFANLQDYTLLYNSRLGNVSNTYRKEQRQEHDNLVKKYRPLYPSGFDLFLKEIYRPVYSCISRSMEAHCPFLKNEIRKMLGKPSRYVLTGDEEISQLIAILKRY